MVEAAQMRDYGGRAVCPVEEYDDLEVREEMVWHALEEALVDAGWLEESRHWYVPWPQLVDVVPALTPGERIRPPVSIYGYSLTFTARTDEHLGEDASGVVDLTARLAPTSNAA